MQMYGQQQAILRHIRGGCFREETSGVPFSYGQIAEKRPDGDPCCMKLRRVASTSFRSGATFRVATVTWASFTYTREVTLSSEPVRSAAAKENCPLSSRRNGRLCETETTSNGLSKWTTRRLSSKPLPLPENSSRPSVSNATSTLRTPTATRLCIRQAASANRP